MRQRPAPVGRVPEAVEALTAVADALPESPEARHNLAVARQRLEAATRQ